jgi:hypothetical protein
MRCTQPIQVTSDRTHTKVMVVRSIYNSRGVSMFLCIGLDRRCMSSLRNMCRDGKSFNCVSLSRYRLWFWHSKVWRISLPMPSTIRRQMPFTVWIQPDMTVVSARRFGTSDRCTVAFGSRYILWSDFNCQTTIDHGVRSAFGAVAGAYRPIYFKLPSPGGAAQSLFCVPVNISRQKLMPALADRNEKRPGE